MRSVDKIHEHTLILIKAIWNAFYIGTSIEERKIRRFVSYLIT